MSPNETANTLSGRRAVVTGGASGIGKAIAFAFARVGATIAVVDLKAESAEAVAHEIAAATGSPCFGLGCDISEEDSVRAAFDNPQITSLDILVNSAGVAHIGTLMDTSAGDFDRLFRVNVRGTYLCMQAAVRHMAPRRSGVLLNLASVAATAGLSQRFAYSMTKGAVLSMTLSAAKDCLPFGIRCNCISPARVHTPFVDGFVAQNYPGREAEMMATLAAAQPIGRMGTPDEIAALALFLCSDAASFITGSDIPIDGGFATLR